MVFKLGDVCIVAEESRNDQLDDRFGKRPCLWVGAGNQLTKVGSFSNEDKARLFNKWLQFFLKEQEPVVVRCKDCKYWQDNNGGYPHPECRWGHDETPEEDDFCSFGERR